VSLRIYATVALLGAASAACADAGDEREMGPPSLHPLPGCEQLDSRPCDARESDCQRRLFEIAACLRGDEPGETPLIRVISRDEYAERLRADYAARPPSDTRSMEHTLALFGLSDEGSYDVEAQIARARDFLWGVYTHDTSEILLIDREVSFDDPEVNAVLVHEFVHALQDRAVGLDAFYDAYALTWDAQLAVGAMIEGDADLIRYRYATSVLGLDPAQVDLGRAFESRIELRWDELKKSQAALASSRMLFAYLYGARYLNHVFQTGGARAVADVWSSPPTTTYAFLASQDGVVEPDFEPVGFEAPEPPEGVTQTSQLPLGAWGLFVLLTKNGQSFEASGAGARAWRGDTYFSYEQGRAAAGIWRIELADADTAERLASQLTSSKLRAEATATTLTLGVRDLELPIDWAFDQ
jgi:hypothetical protein